jgi:hypothetical protein
MLIKINEKKKKPDLTLGKVGEAWRIISPFKSQRLGGKEAGKECTEQLCDAQGGTVFELSSHVQLKMYNSLLHRKGRRKKGAGLRYSGKVLCGETKDSFCPLLYS